jgi:ADP-ribosyl-[dinitrogen reductase] hydrolase
LSGCKFISSTESWLCYTHGNEQVATQMHYEENMVSDSKMKDRFRGALIGLAAGDAVGTTLEFKQPGSFEPITDMIGGGPFLLEAGQWTDDTSMAMCLAESLLACDGFNPRDQMERYLRWYQDGYWSSTGACFDIGNTVRAALDRFRRTGEPYSGSENPRSAGNGSLMRLAPVVLFFSSDPHYAVQRAADSSRTTHATAAAVDACRYAASLILGALAGVQKDKLLGDDYWPPPFINDSPPISPEIAEIAGGSFREKQPPQIKGTGYVVRSLEAALWAFHYTNAFREGCLLAANLGDDADTTAAIYGQFAGAYYGMQNIPQAWRQKLARHEDIVKVADGLFAASQRHAFQD